MLAILIVVYEHGRLLIPNEIRQFYLSFQPIKIDGVSIFFVLSGFLIGSVLIRIVVNTRFQFHDLMNFWIRRWFRTLPNYFLVLIIINTYYQLIRNSEQGIDFSYFFFLQNLAWPHPAFFAEAWSLSVEEWFYLLFPLFVFIAVFFFKDNKKSLIIGILIFLLMPQILRMVFHNAAHEANLFDEMIRKVVVFRLDSIVYGVLASFIAFRYPAFWFKTRRIFLIMGFFAVLLLYLNNDLLNPASPFYFINESLIILCFIPYLSQWRSVRWRLLEQSVTFISKVSYSMYLIHRTVIIMISVPILKFYLQKFELEFLNTSLFVSIYYWSVTLFGSYLLYKYFELPMTGLRDKIKFGEKAMEFSKP
jgi:peptidoglycan/LPS O-acetylase OafA/YrhL